MIDTNLLDYIEQILIISNIDNGYCKLDTESILEYTRPITVTNKGYEVQQHKKINKLSELEDYTDRLNELPKGKHEGVLVGMRIHKKRHKFEDVEEFILVF